MKPKYIQVDCKETDKLDLRQAKAVLKHKPDIIVLEYPNNNQTPNLEFNRFGALEKPKKMVEERLKEFPEAVLKIHPVAIFFLLNFYKGKCSLATTSIVLAHLYA